MSYKALDKVTNQTEPCQVEINNNRKEKASTHLHPLIVKTNPITE